MKKSDLITIIVAGIEKRKESVKSVKGHILTGCPRMQIHRAEKKRYIL